MWNDNSDPPSYGISITDTLYGIPLRHPPGACRYAWLQSPKQCWTSCCQGVNFYPMTVPYANKLGVEQQRAGQVQTLRTANVHLLSSTQLPNQVSAWSSSILAHRLQRV